MASRRVIPERWIIYCLINTKTGKCYIGVTNHTLEFRWRAHVRASTTNPARGIKDTFLWMAIRKYGPETFEISILDTVATRKEAMETEKDFISVFDSRAPGGYNMTIGGEGVSPRPPISEETRAKLRAAHLGVPVSAAHRANIGNAHRGRVLSPKELQNLNLRHGVPQSPESRAKISSAQKGKKRGPRSPEAKANMRTAALKDGRKPSFSGHTHSIETKEKLRTIMIESGRHPTFADHKHSIEGRIGTNRRRRYLPGVFKNGRKWGGRITINGQRIFLGSFHTEKEAHETYMTALEFHFQAGAPC